MNPLIRLPDKVVPLSVLEHDRESRARYLAEYRGVENAVYCLCRSDGIPMGVARRAVPYETYYLYHLHRTDPQRHVFGCPHRIVQSSQGEHATVPLLQTKDGFVNVHLNIPLFQLEPQEKALAGNAPHAHRFDERKATGGNLFTLLELLWSQAELNVWHPGFAGRRSYYVVRERLIRAAAGIRVRGKELVTRLYLPPVYKPAVAQEIERGLTEFMDRLIEPNGKRWYGFVGGLLRKTEETEGGAVLHLAHTRLRLSANTTPREMPPCFVLTHVLRRGAHRALSVEDMTVLQLADTVSWIPVGTGHERELALHLVENRRRFRKPLAIETSGTDAMLTPAFVLEDRHDRTHLEILTDTHDGRHTARWAAKEAEYTARGQAVWVWNPAKSAAPQGLPSPHRARGVNAEPTKSSV